MNKKLTLSMQNDVIEAAKDYAESNQTSLSSLVEGFFVELINKNSKNNKKKPKKYPGIVGELSGIVNLNDPRIKNDEYAQHLLKKYS